MWKRRTPINSRALFFLTLLSAAAPLCRGGYSFSQTVTVDHTKVPNTNQANFAVLISGTYADLRTVGNGGKVTNSSGFDIVFGSDSACASLYNFNLETYSDTTGAVNFWVKLPLVTTATDTVFFLCFGNAAISTYQGNDAGTWDSSFLGVWHYPNGVSLSLADSTANARNGSNGSVSPLADAGKIDGGSSSTVTNTGYSTYSSTGLPAGTANRTISAWFGPKSAGGTDPANYILLYGKAGTNSQAQGMHATRQSIATCAAGTGDIYKITYVGWNDDLLSSASYCSQPSVFHYVALTFSAAGTIASIYLDGAPGGSGAKASWNTTLTGTLFINEADPGVFAGNCSCVVDEARIANVVRSADWIATEYNNQSSPSTFYTMGSLTPLGGHGLLLGGVG